RPTTSWPPASCRTPDPATTRQAQPSTDRPSFARSTRRRRGTNGCRASPPMMPDVSPCPSSDLRTHCPIFKNRPQENAEDQLRYVALTCACVDVRRQLVWKAGGGRVRGARAEMGRRRGLLVAGLCLRCTAIDG